MPSTTNAFGTLNATILAVFAEPFVYQSPAGDVPLSGVFEQINNGVHVGAAKFKDQLHSLQLNGAEVAAHGILLGQTVVVRGGTYTIIDLQADLGGMATLTLRSYT